MNRRAFMCGLGSAIAGVPHVCSAQVGDTGALGGAWQKIPSVVVMSSANDARLPAVYEAIAFWNAVFVNLGSPFRFGPVVRVAATITDDDIRPYSDGGFDELRLLYDWSTGSFNLRERVSTIPGDVIIVLSATAKRSFALGYPKFRKVLVVIQGPSTSAIKKPNTTQNVIAHELGHAVGLDHNKEEDALMCGSMSCSVVRAAGGFPRLTRSDKLKLLELYPPGWQGQARW